MSDVALGTVSASVRLKLSDLRSDMAKAQQEFRAMSAEMRKQASEASRQMTREIGTKMQVAGAATAIGLGAATKAAADFDQAMRNVNSIAKENERGFQNLRKSVMGVADDPKIRQGPIDLAKGLYDVYSSGFKGKQAMDVLRQSAYGASAGMTTTATSSRALMAVLNSGIKGVTSAKDAMDVLFKIVDRGVVNFEQLAGSIGQVLPTAAKAGVSIQHVGAAIALATKQGQSGAEAINDLNNLLLKIAKPSEESARLFRQLGISYGFAGLEAKGLPGILDEIMRKTRGNKEALAQLFPDQQAFRSAMTLMKNNGKDFRIEIVQVDKATQGLGSTQEALTQQNKGAAAQGELLKKKFEQLRIETGEALLPAMNRLVDALRGGIDAFRSLSPETRSAATQITLVGGVALIAGGSMLKLAANLATAKTAFDAIGWSAGNAIGRIRTTIGLAGIAAAAWKVGSLDNSLTEAREEELRAQKRAASYPGAINKMMAEKLDLENRLKSGGAGSAAAQWLVGKKGKQLSENAVRDYKDRIKRLDEEMKRLDTQSRKQNAANALERAREMDRYYSNKSFLNPAGASKQKTAAEKAKEEADRLKREADALIKNGANTPPIFGFDPDAGKSKGRRKSDAERALEKARREAEEQARRQRELQRDIAELMAPNDFAKRRVRAQFDLDREMQEMAPGRGRGLATERYRLTMQRIQEEEAMRKREASRVASQIGAGVSGAFGAGGDWIAAEAKRRGGKAASAVGTGISEAFALYNERMNLARKEAEESRRFAEEKAATEYRVGTLSLAQYRQFVIERMAETGKESREYLRLLELKHDLDKRGWEDFRKRLQLQGGGLTKEMAQGAEGNFGPLRSAMQTLGQQCVWTLGQSLNKGFGGILGNVIANTLTTTLSNLIDNAISGIGKKSKKKKGGGLFGGILPLPFGIGSVLGSILNFDDPVNDRAARHYGWDFADMFLRGSQDFAAQRQRAPAPSAGGAKNYHFTVNFGTVNVASDMDVRTMGEAIAWHAKEQLGVKVS